MLPLESPKTIHARSTILDAIRAAGSTSRAEVAEVTGFTGATVSTTVRGLMDDGFVEETGLEASTGGKRRRTLRLVDDARYGIGVHLDQGVIRCVLANLAGELVASDTDEGLGMRRPEELIEHLADRIDQMVAQSCVERSLILGIGVCAPGPVSPESAMTLSPPHLEAWSHFPLATALENATGLPVVLDNDATACALGEHWTMQPGSRCMATLYLGTGLGGGVIIDGVPYRGVSGNAVEVGHMCVDLDGPLCWCGSVGCVEAVAGPQALVNRAYDLGLFSDEGQSCVDSFRSLADLAHAGNVVALELFADSARHLAVAAHTLACIFDPDHIALTGPSFAAAADLYLPAISDAVSTRHFGRTSHAVTILVSRHADDAAVIGAAALIFQSALILGQVPSAASV